MEKRITKRFVLHVGYSCNERCIFCYYRNSLERGAVKDYSTNNIKKKLNIGRRYGKIRVDFSGGEPTIRKDLPELIRYAKRLGYETICIITNGLRMSDKGYCKQLLNAGLNDCLFSLHSSFRDMHDSLTCVKGSWDKLNQAMKNMKELNAHFRINTVVNNLNFDQLDSYFKLLRRYDPAEINLLVFNPAEEACKYREDDATVEDYNIIGSKITEALDKFSDYFKTINVRFLPFCLMKGHEKQVRTMWQKIYEKAEWDPYLFLRFRKSYFHAVLSLFVGAILSPFMLPRYGKRSFYTFLGEFAQITRIFYNNKHLRACKKCALRRICPGLHRAYIKKFNKTIVYHYDGKVIHDPLYFVMDLRGKFEV